jgi:hypothetical protein
LRNTHQRQYHFPEALTTRLPPQAEPEERQKPLGDDLSIAEASPVRKAPREPDDQPWEHPADSGEPLDGHALWTNTKAFDTFQTSEEFPDDLAQAMRRVLEKMHRSGFRDWEPEVDYVECSYWFLRRNLELVAPEAFRIWYGEGQWQTPYRMASRLQETGQIEYSIDHLLTSALGVVVRKREATEFPHGLSQEAPTPARKRRARRGEMRHAFRAILPTVMRREEFLTCEEIAARLDPLVEFAVNSQSVHNFACQNGRFFEKRRSPSRGQRFVQFSLSAHP